MQDNQQVSNVEIPQQQQAVEKMIPQSEVNELVGTARKLGHQKGYSDALSQSAQPPGVGGVQTAPQISPDLISQRVSDEVGKHIQSMQQQQQQQMAEDHAKKTITELQGKAADAKSRYSDFDDVTGQVDFREVPQVLALANLADNGGDVLYELAKNPAKMGALLSLPPNLAALEIRKMSNSIKQNQQALSQEMPAEPLNRINPSSIGSGDGQLNVRDLKSKYRR